MPFSERNNHIRTWLRRRQLLLSSRLVSWSGMLIRWITASKESHSSQALQYGMPLTAAGRIGIDRRIRLFTDQASVLEQSDPKKWAGL